MIHVLRTTHMASETEIVTTMDQILLAGHLDLERRFQQTSKTSLEGQTKPKENLFQQLYHLFFNELQELCLSIKVE